MKEYHENNLSASRMKKLKKATIYPIVVLGVVLTFINLYFFLNALLLLVYIQVIIVSALSILYMGDYISDSASPKYIMWNQKEIKIINLRGKKERISWSDINEIECIREYHMSAEKDPDYVISLKDRIFPNRFVSPKIGRQLQEIYKEYKETGKLQEIPRTEVPFHKTARGGLFLLVITFFSLFFSAILMVIYSV